MSYNINSTPTELLAEIGRHEILLQKKSDRLRVLALALRAAADDRRHKTDVWWAMLASTVADMMVDEDWSVISRVVKYQDELDAGKKVGA